MSSPVPGLRTPFLGSPAILPPAAALLSALLLAGCSSVPMVALADPANPATSAPPVAYRPVTAGYESRRPVEPRPWREQNDRVAPAR
jgi:hypothetical protein